MNVTTDDGDRVRLVDWKTVRRKRLPVSAIVLSLSRPDVPTQNMAFDRLRENEMKKAETDWPHRPQKGITK